MEVEVSLFANFQKNRFARQRITLPEKATAVDLVKRLEIDPDDVGILVVNREDAALSRTLADGDRITLIPVIGGG